MYDDWLRSDASEDAVEKMSKEMNPQNQKRGSKEMLRPDAKNEVLLELESVLSSVDTLKNEQKLEILAKMKNEISGWLEKGVCFRLKRKKFGLEMDKLYTIKEVKYCNFGYLIKTHEKPDWTIPFDYGDVNRFLEKVDN